MSEAILRDAAALAVRLATERGATDAECTVAEGDEFSATVRLGEVETLKEAGSRGAGLRVLLGKQQGSSYTSDLTDEGISQMVDAAIAIAQITEEDPFAGLPEREELGQIEGDLQLSADDVSQVDAASRIDAAKRAEATALAADPRITNSEGAGCETYTGSRAFANSRGFLGSYSSTTASLSVTPVARQGEEMERDYWHSVSRSWAGLESPETVGRKAAERTLRRLGGQKIATCKATVVFEPRVAKSLLGHIFEAVSGESIYRKSSFLLDKLHQQIAASSVTLIDDATIPGYFGTSPFDDEGVPSRRTVIVQNGVLQTYLFNTYSARKLGAKTTGNASRGLTGAPGIGHGTLYLEPGPLTPEEIFAAVGTGLYVTELIGFGVNTVTGDYSRGAAGLWIEDGKLGYPVAEITVAGNLNEMLHNILHIGNDLEFRGSTCAPTLAVGGMTISGK
ncbi:MAG TPA: metallopeptidase TldD-related protein [Bryobacteraceae bacterium]|nr:metallopeptidase TldD-related protein [Bryobacteraceae bacterium]